MTEIFPYLLAMELLEFLGIDFEAVYNERGGMRREQLKLINRYQVLTDTKANAYKTIKRLEKSANKQNIDFAANLKNTMLGTLSNQIMTDLGQSEAAEQIIIRWIPSSARRHRVIHALEYGKTMTLKQATRKGLGLDYGCQCGMQIIKGREYALKAIKKYQKRNLKK